MNLNRKSGLILLVALMMAFLVSGCSDTRMGYIDTERVMKESPKIQNIIKEAEDAYTKKNQEISAKLDQDKASMSEEDFQKAAVQARSELAAVQAPYSSQLRSAVDNALAEIAKEKKLSAIVEKDHMDYNPMGQAQKTEFVVQGGVDVTEDLIQKLQ